MSDDLVRWLQANPGVELEQEKAWESLRYNKNVPLNIYRGKLCENLIQTMAAQMIVPWILTDGKAHVCRRMMNLAQAIEAQEATNAATGGGWVWIADTDGLYDHITEMY